MGRKKESEYYSELAKKKFTQSTSENSTQAFLNAGDRVCSPFGKFSCGI